MPMVNKRWRFFKRLFIARKAEINELEKFFFAFFLDYRFAFNFFALFLFCLFILLSLGMLWKFFQYYFAVWILWYFMNVFADLFEVLIWHKIKEFINYKYFVMHTYGSNNWRKAEQSTDAVNFYFAENAIHLSI